MPKVTKVMVSLRSIFFNKNDRATQSLDSEAFEGRLPTGRIP
jgi:hypothetical protein